MKLISSKTMEAILQSDFSIYTEDYVHRYPDWINDGLSMIGVKGLRMHVIKKLESKNGIHTLPCNVGELDSLIIKTPCGFDFLPINEMALPCCCDDNAQFSTEYTARMVDYNKLKTNYKGDVYAAFIDVKKDRYGMPMIPDNAFVKQALGYFIVHKMCLAGYKHPTLNFETAYQLWEKHYPRASNDINWMNSQERIEFVNMWTNIYDNLN